MRTFLLLAFMSAFLSTCMEAATKMPGEDYGFRLKPMLNSAGEVSYVIISCVAKTGPATNMLRVNDRVMRVDKTSFERPVHVRVFEDVNTRLALSRNAVHVQIREGGFNGTEKDVYVAPGPVTWDFLLCAPLFE